MSDKPLLAKGSIGQFGGRVGHKAAGFISKKFFHPSNYKNQEKLWAAIEAKKEQERRQDELLKKREEERRVESLIAGMDLNKKSFAPIASTSVSNSATSPLDLSNQETRAAIETRKRLSMLRESQSHSSPSSDHPPMRLSLKSRFDEDVLENGHTEIWGSYFDLETKKWGYGCCKVVERAVRCPDRERSPKQRRE